MVALPPPKVMLPNRPKILASSASELWHDNFSGTMEGFDIQESLDDLVSDIGQMLLANRGGGVDNILFSKDRRNCEMKNVQVIGENRSRAS